MKPRQLHEWNVTTEQARAIQSVLASEVRREGEVETLRLIAGADISVASKDGIARGAVVVVEYPEMYPVEVVELEQSVAFPYIPGLLSFREAPLLLAAWEKLQVSPDLFLVDGQGIAHPRRLGLASHLGLLLDLPTIGCAKSLLCGEHKSPGNPVGSWTEIVHQGEVVGAALRTREGVTPVYVSTGHRISLSSAIAWVLRCCRGHRLPEPARLAHMAAGGHLSMKTFAGRNA